MADASGSRLSLAGWWYALVSVPLAQFLLVRWYYRIFLWARFLRQLSGVNLRLVPTHPDRVGGLGFLSLTTFAFTPLAVAHGALVSAWIAHRLFLGQGVLLDYKVQIIAVVVLMLALVFGPLLLFSPQLSRAWRRGVHDYGSLAQRYAQEFERKWVRPLARTDGAAPREPRHPVIGGHASGSTTWCGRCPSCWSPGRRSLQVLAATLVPLAPLALFMIPFGELVKALAGMLF